MIQRKVPPPVPAQEQPREDMELLKTEYTLDHFGMAILSSIAKGQHSEQAILREYVQNAIDATNREELTVLEEYLPEVVVSVQGRSLFVYDNGIGMDWEGIDRARAIAISEKAALAVVQGGFRGIGLWSGLGIAEQLLVVTTMLGDPYKYVLEIDFAEIANLTETTETVQALERYVRIFRQPSVREDHYTMIQLKNIASPFFQFFENPEDMAAYISGNLPMRFNPEFSHSAEIESKLKAHVADFALADIRVDGKSIFNLYTDALEVEAPEYCILKHDRATLAYMWYCIRKENGKIRDDRLANFAIRAKGYQVGPRGYLLADVTDSHLLAWYTGEVHVVHPDLRPDVKRMEFDTTPAKKWLEHELEEKARELTQSARRRSANENCLKALNDRIKPFADTVETQLAGNLSSEKATLLLEELEGRLSYVSGGRGLENKYIAGDSEKGIPRNDTLMRELKRTERRLKQLQTRLGERTSKKPDLTATTEGPEEADGVEQKERVTEEEEEARPQASTGEQRRTGQSSAPQPKEGDIGKKPTGDKTLVMTSGVTVDTALVCRILECIRQVIDDPAIFSNVVKAVQDELGIPDGTLLES